MKIIKIVSTILEISKKKTPDSNSHWRGEAA